MTNKMTRSRKQQLKGFAKIGMGSQTKAWIKEQHEKFPSVSINKLNKMYYETILESYEEGIAQEYKENADKDGYIKTPYTVNYGCLPNYPDKEETHCLKDTYSQSIQSVMEYKTLTCANTHDLQKWYGQLPEHGQKIIDGLLEASYRDGKIDREGHLITQ